LVKQLDQMASCRRCWIVSKNHLSKAYIATQSLCQSVVQRWWNGKRLSYSLPVGLHRHGRMTTAATTGNCMQGVRIRSRILLATLSDRAYYYVFISDNKRRKIRVWLKCACRALHSIVWHMHKTAVNNWTRNVGIKLESFIFSVTNDRRFCLLLTNTSAFTYCHATIELTGIITEELT